MVADLKQGGEELDKAPFNAKGPLAAREEEMLAFWNREHIFEKSLQKPAPKGDFVFYDGPPFATGLPHYGHLLQSTIKDAVPRYRTMQGWHVPRRWGWDCHGLPLENQIEQELGFKTKRDIEEYGIQKFNTAAQNAVLRYASDWQKIIERFGRWVDMEHDYRTMDASYTESVWWAFKTLYDKGLVYEGFKAMQLCPRCGTTLSNNEVAQGYKDIEDIAVTVKLPLVDESNTSLLIWTTTPWTLPGNTAAAVNAEATYVKVKIGEEFFIVAKDLMEKLSGGEVFAEFLGKTLVGKKYEPPFDYFKNEIHKHKTHAFKVYAAGYVTLDSGTGIVHLAPAFGAEDLALAEKEKIPLIHHVTDEGRFIATVTDFAHLLVKPKGNPKETDAKIAKWLDEKNLLYKQEYLRHSYPHCWRCDTPLLNWASNSWFVKVSALKNKLLAQNAKVSWVPGHVGTGRFNNLLQGAPDWAISRSRYWGAPLPVWRHSKTKELKVIGSVGELLPLVRKSGNRYFVMRHGQARSNVEERLDSGGDLENHLTDYGREGVRASARTIQSKSEIDIIVTSPVPRAKETAALLQKEFNLPDSAVMVDERLRERAMGVFDGKLITEWVNFYMSLRDQFERAPEGAETFTEVKKRVAEFLFEIESRYTNKRVLIVTHGDPAWTLFETAMATPYKTLVNLDTKRGYLHNAEVREISFTPYPHNAQFELDLHRPYIDDIKLGDSLRGEWERVPDVFDCWFESGSMPYASNSYPQKKDTFNPKRLFGLAPKGYPAHFIAEGIDQTRGWFYSLIVLGVGLFGKTPYKAVITNGLILAQDGRKMSKKLKNYPDPMELVEKFGADALRYYLLSSTVIRGEDLRFFEKGVEDVSKKILMRLDNVRSFYELYCTQDSAQKKVLGSASPQPDYFSAQSPASSNVLDRWILARLNQVITESTAGYESYQLDDATRPIADFVDDLSTWYVRRSRDRFKSEGDDKQAALATLRTVLYTIAHVGAPVMPFFAEYLFLSVRHEGDAESVHLSEWPKAQELSAEQKTLIDDMAHTRTLASLGLQAREKAGVKLRQPLAKLIAKKLPADPELCEVLKDELNIKEVVEDAAQGEEVTLDLALTAELKEEGVVRELARTIQEWRKQEKMQMSDRPHYVLKVSAADKHTAEKYKAELMAQTNLGSLQIEAE
ncbi:MAG TPA: class I tRNA ligase family protein [Candidatus Paceibacterota bacterium]|nr:class I tRNA ligase family protein [Candidatus Paceibacterota bacterium]